MCMYVGGGDCEMVFIREAIAEVFLGTQQPQSTAEAANWALGSGEAPELQ